MNLDNYLRKEWQLKIQIANQNNIFCHCQNCGFVSGSVVSGSVVFCSLSTTTY